MLAPDTRPAPSKSISTNFPKREELSLRTVLALPKASSRGLDSSTCVRVDHHYRSKRHSGMFVGCHADSAAESCHTSQAALSAGIMRHLALVCGS